MNKRIKILGALVGVVGIAFLGLAAFTALQVKAGEDALQQFSAAQNVTLEYNEDGVLTDRGEVAGAEAILTLLEDDWGYNVKASELNPSDPLVNTASEYMYQMALIAHHTLTGSAEVVLTEDVEYNGETFPAGTYTVDADGKYWADFDRMHPLEGAARAQIWSPTAHGLIAELGVGSVTASTLQLGYGVAGLIAGLGVVFILIGSGLAWAAAGDKKTVALSEAPAIETIDEPVNA
jgi:hypothetical protein